MKNLSEQMDVQTEIGSKEATENTSTMKDNVSTNVLNLETDVSDSLTRLLENATSSSNDMNTNASMSADTMKTNVTNSTKTMANQAESDWNRLRMFTVVRSTETLRLHEQRSNVLNALSIPLMLKHHVKWQTEWFVLYKLRMFHNIVLEILIMYRIRLIAK